MTTPQETAPVPAERDADLVPTPLIDQAVLALYQEGEKLLEYARGRTVASVEDARKATDDLAAIAGYKKKLEEARKGYVGPLNAHVAAINAAFKDFGAPFVQADVILRQKVQAYRAEQDRVRLEEEKINRLRTEAAQREMELKGELTEPVNLVPVSQAPAKLYHGLIGAVGTTKTWQFEVEDFTLLPPEYKLPDNAKIGKAVRVGVHIPGVRAWQEETLRVTPGKLS